MKVSKELGLSKLHWQQKQQWHLAVQCSICAKKSARRMVAFPSLALLERPVLCSRRWDCFALTALAAKLGPSSAATGGARLMLWFLQCLLAHCLSAINTLVAGEIQAVLGPRPDVMDKYLGKGAAFCSRQARRPGNLSHDSCMAASVAHRLP